MYADLLKIPNISLPSNIKSASPFHMKEEFNINDSKLNFIMTGSATAKAAHKMTLNSPINETLNTMQIN